MARKRKKPKSRYLSRRSARQAAALKKTLATPEARALKRTASKRSWEEHPERHERASASIKKTWEVAAVRKRRISGIKNAWTPNRIEAQREATKKIMADPELNARRIAGLRRVATDPELNALRIANLKKANADPAVLGRKIRKMKKTLHTPEVNARRRATTTKFWDEIRAARATQTAAAKTRKGPGAPKKTERNKRILELRNLYPAPNWDLGDIARAMDPGYDKHSSKEKTNARGAISKVLKRAELPKKQETPA